MLCPLCPVKRKSKATVFKESFRRDKLATGDSVFRYPNISSGSQDTLFLGKLGLLLKIPFNSLITKGWVPTAFPSITNKEDKALLAVFIAL